MDQLQFKVSSGLKNILGQDLITSDNIAILELVKNSYDAHATKVVITFEDDCITIADNGKGMNLNDLKTKWLFVGYSAKSDGSEDANYRNKLKRNFAGAKGIGRISCDRLGQKVVLTTKSEESDEVERIYVDWTLFEQSLKKEFDRVPVEHESFDTLYPFPGDSQTGTEIKISNFREEAALWDRDKIKDLRKSLEKMINPFSGTDDFCIEIRVPALLEEDKKIEDEILNESNDSSDVVIAKKRNEIVNGEITNTIADVLSIKTTLIESTIKDGIIKTRVTDRGELMYEIQEVSTYPKLEDVSINIYYLNRAAKYTFTQRMGVQPTGYGSVMLFRNGFRIWPYGEVGDDSWKLDRRALQGRNRYLGTRDLFGRVDVETSDVSAFKEVSSRDGGLIMTEAANQLMDYFRVTHRRLERYVVGVLWGEGFLRNEYFKSQDIGILARLNLQDVEKESNSTEHLYQNIGSKVDFLQLIKSLVNDKNVVVTSYNDKLADVVSDVTYAEVLQNTFIDSIKEVAAKTSDEALANNIEVFEQQLAEMNRLKKEAEKKAEAERKKAEAERKAKEEAERKAREEELKRIEKEKELDAQKQKNLYLAATRNTTQEVQDITHAISIASTELICLISNLSNDVIRDSKTKNEILQKIHEAGFFANKVKQLSMLITKADIVSLKSKVRVDVKKYIEEYLSNFKESIAIEIVNDSEEPVWKMFSLLDVAIVIDNLFSNSKKNGANKILVTFVKQDRTLMMDFSDDGDGVDLSIFTKETIFDEGVTNKTGGSGIGLHTIKYTLQNKLNGDISFEGNGLNQMKGATFRIIFK